MITVDSLSKVLWPGLRLGWVRANATVMSELRLAKAISDMWTSNLSQCLGLAFLDHLDGLLAERIGVLETRMEFAVEALAEAVPEWSITKPAGGMFLWAQLPVPVARQLAPNAGRHGVLIGAADAFSAGGVVDDRIRVPFTAPVDQLAAGIERLGEAWRTLDPDTPPPLPSGRNDLIF